MFKYLDCELKIGGIPTQLNQCLEKGLIKQVDKNDYEFLVLEKNLDELKSILGDSYDTIAEFSFKTWVEQELVEHSHSIEVEDCYGDEIEITSQEMFEIISEDFDSYIDDLNKAQIYESDKPIEKLEELLNEIGRKELNNRLEGLKNNISNAKFR